MIANILPAQFAQVLNENKNCQSAAKRRFKFNSAILVGHLFPPLFRYFLAHSFGYGLQNELRWTKKSALA
ncbi:MAG: hypothetical protein AAGN35_24550, partial [Bacteroidota bacterium]